MSYAMFYLQSRGAAGDYECDHIHASYSKQLNPNELNRLKCDLVNLNHKTLFCFMGAVFQKNWRKQWLECFGAKYLDESILYGYVKKNIYIYKKMMKYIDYHVTS